jgi:hypothetical protein
MRTNAAGPIGPDKVDSSGGGAAVAGLCRRQERARIAAEATRKKRLGDA